MKNPDKETQAFIDDFRLFRKKLHDDLVKLRTPHAQKACPDEDGLSEYMDANFAAAVNELKDAINTANNPICCFGDIAEFIDNAYSLLVEDETDFI